MILTYSHAAACRIVLENINPLFDRSYPPLVRMLLLVSCREHQPDMIVYFFSQSSFIVHQIGFFKPVAAISSDVQKGDRSDVMKF